MSDNISSSVLFHFTKSMPFLKSILRYGFSPRYCLEYDLNPSDRRAASRGQGPSRGSAMICFCDLPLSLIKDHLREYGRFGIGLRKEWGLKNRLAPVIYTHERASTRPILSRISRRAAKGNDPETISDIRILSAYSKPFRGPAWRNGRCQKNVEFYDEREWRYTPITEGDPPVFLERGDIENSEIRRAYERCFKQRFALRIHPNDIQYLIVPYDKCERNVLELHYFLKKLYGKRDAILVTTTLMTDDCIAEDI